MGVAKTIDNICIMGGHLVKPNGGYGWSPARSPPTIQQMISRRRRGATLESSLQVAGAFGLSEASKCDQG
jgi:hypothetical protein